MKIYSMIQTYDFNGHHLIEIKQNEALEKRYLFTKDQIELLISREFARISFEKYSQLKKLKKSVLYRLGFSRHIQRYKQIYQKEIIVKSCFNIDDTVKDSLLYRDKIFSDI